MEDNFGAKPLLSKKKKQDTEAEFGAKPIEQKDESWGRFFLRKGRGLAAGAAGIPGDIEEMVRSSPKVAGRATLGPQFNTEENYTPGRELSDEERYLYSTQDIKNAIDKKGKEFGYDLKPHGFWEEAEDSALEFIGAGGTTGALTRGIKGAKAATKLPELLSSTAMGVSHQAGEELDLPPLARIGLTVATGRKVQKAAPSSAKDLVQGAKSIGKAAATPVKTGKEALAKQIAKAGKFKEEVVDAAGRRGITPLLSNVVESRGLQSVESALKESALTGPHYENRLKQISAETKEAFDRVLDNISPDTRTGREVAESAVEQFKKNAELAKEDYKMLYERSSGAIPKGSTTSYRETKNTIENLKKTLNKTALVKGQRAEALSVLNEIEKNLNKEAYEEIVKRRLDSIVDGTGKKTKATPNQRERIEKQARQEVRNGQGKVSPETLLGTEDALNDYIDWNTQGGIKKVLKKALQANKSDIAAFGQNNPSFQSLYKAADTKFADYAKRMRNDVINSIMKKEVPENVLSKMNNVSNIRKIEKALAQNKEGKEIMQSLKRVKLQELLEGKMLNSEGVVKHQTFANALKDPKKQDMLKELVGSQNYKRLKDLQKYSSDLAHASEKFSNPSRSGTKGVDIAIGATLAGQVLRALATGNPSVITATTLKTLGQITAPRLLSKLLTDKEFVELTIQAARNAKNPKAYRVFQDRLAERILKVGLQSKPTQNKSQEEKNQS